MTNADTPTEGLLARAGGIRGLVYSALPVTTFAAVSPAAGLVPASIAALFAAVAILGWQLMRRETTRPAVLGFAGVAVCVALAYVTGQARNFYLPGIWMYLVWAIVFTVSVLIRRPLVGVVWAKVTGRDDTWRRVPRVRLAFDGLTVMLAAVSWTRFLVQYYLYDTGREGLLAVARIAMGWPVFAVAAPLMYLAIRAAVRALPNTSAT